MRIESSWADYTTIRDHLLYLVACTYKIERPTLLMPFRSQQVAANALSTLMHEGLIESSNTRPAIIKLSRKGVDLLKQTDPNLYAYYRRNTNNGDAGRTAKHAELRQRSAEAMVVMETAGIKIGSQRPSAQQIFAAVAEKNSIPDAVYYQMRELRYVENQVEARSSISRAAGLLIAPELQGLVYNIGDVNMEISKDVERRTILAMGPKVRELYDGLPFMEIANSIVLGKADEQTARILSVTSCKKGKKRTFGDTVADRKMLYTDMRYIPLSAAGADYIRFIANTPQERIIQMLFTSQEISEARAHGVGDAIIKGLIVYEFVSCNITKLAEAKRRLDKQDNVGIVLRKSQVDFVTEFLGRGKINLRQLDDEIFRTGM